MIYTDVMLDLETVGRTPGDGIICIAAVLFNINTGAISEKYRFRMNINWDKQRLAGFRYSKETLNWWKNTDKNLFKTLSESDNHYVEVGKQFQHWFRQLPNYRKLRMWGNSVKFDIGILEGWYRKSIGGKFQQFWDTWLERDVRTIKALDPKLAKSIAFKGKKHNPIDDCLHQIRYCRAIVKKYKLKIH